MPRQWNRQSVKRCIIATFLVLFTVMQTAQAASRYVFIHSDMLGSPMATTDENGNIISREQVTPYGDSLGKRDSTNSVAVGSPEHGPGYTGHVRDKDLGLTYMQARYYDPTIGRFMGADPVGFLDTGDPAYFNRYAYAKNNPYKYVDPDGRAAGAINTGMEMILGGFTVGPIEAYHVGLGDHASFAQNLAGDLVEKYDHEEINTEELRNAFRHVAWQASITLKHGKSKAKQIGNLHERGEEETRDSQADQHNNEIGRSIGDSVSSLDGISNEISEQYEEGNLITDLDDSQLNPEQPKYTEDDSFN